MEREGFIKAINSFKTHFCVSSISMLSRWLRLRAGGGVQSFTINSESIRSLYLWSPALLNLHFLSLRFPILLLNVLNVIKIQFFTCILSSDNLSPISPDHFLRSYALTFSHIASLSLQFEQILSSITFLVLPYLMYILFGCILNAN